MRPGLLLQSPRFLVASLLAGAAFGAWAPLPMTWIGALGQGYIAVLNLVGLPLIVLSVWSGLRQWADPAGAGWPLLRVALAGVGVMALFAAVGSGITALMGPGHGLGPSDAQAIGQLALRVEPRASVALLGADPPEEAGPAWDPLLTDNGYRALAYGTLASALMGVVFFGIGLAAQPDERYRAFLSLAQGVQRSLERLAEHAARWLPVFAFVLAASCVHAVGVERMVRLQGFLLPFALGTALAVAVAVLGVAWRAAVPARRVLAVLRVPVVVSLFSTGPAAAVPALVDALCNQLGYRRDLLAVFAPVLPAFLRAGDAVFLSVLAVFLAHLYGKPLAVSDLAWIAGAATVLALASVSLASGWSLAAAGLLAGWMTLPFEALLPTFVLLEALTAGMRNLVSLLVVAPVLALVSGDVSRGLAVPVPVLASMAPARAAPRARYPVVLRLRQVLVLGTLLALCLLAAALAGIGVGLREAQGPHARHHDALLARMT